MPLVPGTHLGPYEILAPLGAGGMGEVYRAKDTRLGREVALKVLPELFANDAQRMLRFEREAQVLASLNHPNISHIHGLEEAAGIRALVMELVEGQTLGGQITRGPIGLEEAVPLAKQIAEGLEYAHEKGFIHRDLKPANIKVTPEGQAKILDFGLAKALERDASVAEMGTSPTISRAATNVGMLLGTAGYMSPEQAKGKPVDRRADIWAFGCVLYEMLTGKRAFEGETTTDTLAAVVRAEPELEQLPERTPVGIRELLRRCLTKDPKQRLQSIGEARIALENYAKAPVAETSGVRPALKSRGGWWFAAVGVALLGIASAFFLRQRPLDTASQLNAAILPPPGDGFWSNITQPAAISPDGKFLALIAMRNGHAQLWLRRLDITDAQPVDGSEDASNPFWSPDSRHIAFFVPGKLKKVDISGGSVTDICPAGAFGMGGAWSPRGVIVFGTFGEGLKRVSDSGGTAEPIKGSELSSEAITQLWPAFLPDGKHFLYLDWRYSTHDGHDNGIWVGSLDGEEARRLPLSSTNAVYSAGYLLFNKDGDLVAQKFDLSRLELSGAVLPVARNIQYDTFFNDGIFTVSRNGTLVYGATGLGVYTELTWLDRSGRITGTLGEPGSFDRQSISPDGKLVAVGVKFPNAREKIWIYDVDQGTRIPLMGSEAGPTLYSPVWSPDGKQVAYRDTLGKSSTLLVHNSDGSGEDQKRGPVQTELVRPTDWSPDGGYFALELSDFQGRQKWKTRLRVMRVDGIGNPLLEIENAAIGKFSPDGHWIAYDDEGSGQLVVTSFPGPGSRIAVSSAGGSDARWRGDGQQLFYISDNLTIVSVDVRESAKEFRVLSSKPLFRLQLPWNVGFYDITRDGTRFLVNTRTLKEQSTPLTVLTNWPLQLQNNP